MKKILLLLVLLSVPVQLSAQSKARVGGGFGWLFMPDLKEFNDVPTIDIMREGGSISLQFLVGKLMGRNDFSWGFELGFLRQYRYEFHTPVLTGVTLNSYPLLAILDTGLRRTTQRCRRLCSSARGVAQNERITELGTPQTWEAKPMDITHDLTLMVDPGVSFRITDRISIDALPPYYLMYTSNEFTTRLNAAAFVGYKL